MIGLDTNVLARFYDAFYSFDDRRFARRANRIGSKPPVSVPKE
jgi:hypothetical protein